MANSQKIEIMISSRCGDSFPLDNPEGRTLSLIRKRIKKEIEEIKVFGKHFFKVWINEDAAEDASLNSWDACMKAVKKCDIFLCLYNGNAGWTVSGKDVGICHAELALAFLTAPKKVFGINISESRHEKYPSEGKDKNFQDYVKKLNRFFPDKSRNEEDLIKQIKDTVLKATFNLVNLGGIEAKRGAKSLGEALDWGKLNYSERSEKIRHYLLQILNEGKALQNADISKKKISATNILFRVSAIPDALSVSAARELVGQPHLNDHKLSSQIADGEGGVVHIIGCYGNVTEANAKKMLGFPDAATVPAPFGIFVLDKVQAIQIVLIENCIDSESTKIGVRRFFDWISETEQDKEIARYATKRLRIIRELSVEV